MRAVPTSTALPTGLRFSVLVDGAASGGRYALADVTGERGARVPLHMHAHEGETVLVLDGELEVRSDRGAQRLRAGEPAILPPRDPHGLEVVSDRARFLLLWQPAGVERLVRTLAGEPALDPDDAAALLAAAGVTLL